jgi:hypothetical protein
VDGPIGVSQCVLLLAVALEGLSGGRSAVQMAVRFSLVPCREGGGRVDALSAGRSIQCELQDAAHVQSRAGTVVRYSVVGGIDGVRVRVEQARLLRVGGWKCETENWR